MVCQPLSATAIAPGQSVAGVGSQPYLCSADSEELPMSDESRLLTASCRVMRWREEAILRQ